MEMHVDISQYKIATPLPVSLTNPVALEVMGAYALANCSSCVVQLEDGSIQFTALTKGAASKSVHRTRTEWKEAEYWALSSAAHHWSRQEITLVKVNSAQKVVVAQVHVKNANTPALKVFWNKGKLTIGFRASFDNPELQNLTILDNVPLGVPFKIAVHVTKAGSVSVSAMCQGRKSSHPPLRLDSSWQDRVLQFHGGIYNQIDYSSTTHKDDGSVCIITELSTTHE
jgi:hypothetical protein